MRSKWGKSANDIETLYQVKTPWWTVRINQIFCAVILILVFIIIFGANFLLKQKEEASDTRDIKSLREALSQPPKIQMSQTVESKAGNVEDNRPIILLPNFGWHNNSNQRERCRWTETNWSIDLVNENYLDVSKLGGCIDFYPPRGKQVGLFFNDRPIKTDGDFTVSSRYDEKNCYFSSKDDCLDFIGSHLNQTLVFEGVHIYVDTGK